MHLGRKGSEVVWPSVWVRKSRFRKKEKACSGFVFAALLLVEKGYVFAHRFQGFRPWSLGHMVGHV